MTDEPPKDLHRAAARVEPGGGIGRLALDAAMLGSGADLSYPQTLHAPCHPGEHFRASYWKGMVQLTCGRCRGLVVTLLVADGKAPHPGDTFAIDRNEPSP